VPILPSPLSRDIDWLLNRVWLGFGEGRAKALEPLGLAVREHLVMKVLTSVDATQLELAAIIHMDKSVLTTTIDSLEAKGYVRRRADPTDRRAKRPQLTPAGKTACTKADSATAKAQEQLLELVPAKFRTELVEVLRNLALGPFASAVSFSQSSERPRPVTRRGR
jgi:DNA-binding MarR family transcriptional regulator